MRRIAYILIDQEGQSSGQGEIYNSERKAQKQINYGVKKEFYEPGHWKIQKVLLENYSKFEAYKDLRDREKVVGISHESYRSGRYLSEYSSMMKFGIYCLLFVGVLFIYGGASIEALESLPIEKSVFEMLLVISSLNILLACFALTMYLILIQKFLKRIIFYLMDVFSWIKYKKEDVEGLERYGKIRRYHSYLTKIDEVERSMTRSYPSGKLKTGEK